MRIVKDGADGAKQSPCLSNSVKARKRARRSSGASGAAEEFGCVVFRKLAEADGFAAGDLADGPGDHGGVTCAVVLIVLNEAFGLPVRHPKAQERLCHGFGRQIKILYLPVEGSRELLSHLGVRQRLRSSNIVDFSFVPGLRESLCRDGGDIANIHNADFDVSRGSVERALRRNCGPEIQKALHEEIRTKKRERNASLANVLLDRAVIALEAARRELVGGKLRELYEMFDSALLRSIHKAALLLLDFGRRGNQEEEAVHPSKAGPNVAGLRKSPSA